MRAHGYHLLIASLATAAFAVISGSFSVALAQDAPPIGPRVGERAPDFTLPTADGGSVTLSDVLAQGKIVVLEWFCPTCRFSTKHHETYSTMRDTYAAYKDRNVAWLAINSSSLRSGAADAALCQERAAKWSIKYPILLDPSGDIGRAYRARVTPEMIIINPEGVIVYRGAVDSEPRELAPPGDVNYVARALDQLLAGESVEPQYTHAYGCSVKY